ncbi:hypothetical protein GCM10022402_03580 [Salinactinospora qingdaonensis]|uniref:Uncharacterized protein n=1 Tax=Salinactinospora qingdaonensis TaxID=702744 RepID=A0ABP7F1H2_9ACTN
MSAHAAQRQQRLVSRPPHNVKMEWVYSPGSVGACRAGDHNPMALGNQVA